MTTTSNIVGLWRLTGNAAVNAKIDLKGEEPASNGVGEWLNGTGEDLLATVEPVAGLELHFDASGRFSERLTGQPDIQWYDAEGVLSKAAPFDGTWTANERAVYLVPDDVPSWAAPTAGQYGAAVLRHDDGDTKICDSVLLRGSALIRTMNIVTDELYLDQIVLVYNRSEPDASEATQ